MRELTSTSIIGGKAPSEYIEIIQRAADINEERMNEILNSHLIAPTLIRKDDFNNFIKLRLETIISLIESVIGKPVVRDIREKSNNLGETEEENHQMQEEFEEEENDEINSNTFQDTGEENNKDNF